MAHYPDLSPYAYGGCSPGVVHVGWLDGVHPFPTGIVAAHLIEKMRQLATKPVELYRGFHICEVCVQPPWLKHVNDPDSWEWIKQRKSNCEIRVSHLGTTFAAPVLIVHYIEEHGYLPPASFLEALESACL